ncbi:MAG: methionine synthase [Candidatus Altiarchaeota archaeon]|nr:methionine synthase [Candidatus Altiarchaeota archaeon]
MNIPTTVIGSYPVRLDGVKYARAYFSGEKNDALSASIREAVSTQVNAGIDIVSDGQTKGDFINIFAKNFRGVAVKERPIVYSEIEYIRDSVVADQSYVKSFLPKNVKLKGIITGPYTMAKGSEDRHYGSLEKLSLAYARGLASEAEKLSKIVDYIQVDEPFFSVDYPDYGRELIEKVFANVDVPKMLHVCGDVSKIFPQLIEYKVDYLEHEFAANPSLWETVSQHSFKQRLGVGVVRSDLNKVESVEEIVGRMCKAFEVVGSEHIIFNPDCGLRNLDPEVAFGKLKNMVSARNRVCEQI